MFKNIKEIENNKLQVRVKVMLLRNRIGSLKEKKIEYKNFRFTKEFEVIISSVSEIKELADGKLRVLNDIIDLNHRLLVLMLEIEHLKECEESVEKDAIICFLKENVEVFDEVLECIRKI